jgi:hypothetical protein
MAMYKAAKRAKNMTISYTKPFIHPFQMARPRQITRKISMILIISQN